MRRSIIALSIVVLYCLMRWQIYSVFPQETVSHWVFRDLVMDGPRLLCLLISLWMGLRIWGPKKLGFHFAWGKLAVISGCFVVLMETMDSFLGSEPFLLSTEGFFWFVLSSFLVAVFEEVLFRGFLFSALEDWKGSLWAVWISSIVFMVFHWQAQPVWAWPGIFFFGMFMALLRARDVSLVWLIVIHFIVDFIPGWVGLSGGPRFAWWPYLSVFFWLVLLRPFFVWHYRYLKSTARVKKTVEGN